MTGPDVAAAPFAATTFFAGPASLAGPASSRLTTDAMLTTEGNRWSVGGEPTIYLAGDLGVNVAEFGRHAPLAQLEPTYVWSVEIELRSVVDLRTPAGRARLDLPEDPGWLLDRARCSGLARRVRETGAHDGSCRPSRCSTEATGGTWWSSRIACAAQSRRPSGQAAASSCSSRFQDRELGR